jgi:hypothetical protein
MDAEIHSIHAESLFPAGCSSPTFPLNLSNKFVVPNGPNAYLSYNMVTAKKQPL